MEGDKAVMQLLLICTGTPPLLPGLPCCQGSLIARAPILPGLPCCQNSLTARAPLLPGLPCCQPPLLPGLPCCQGQGQTGLTCTELYHSIIGSFSCPLMGVLLHQACIFQLDCLIYFWLFREEDMDNNEDVMLNPVASACHT